MIHNVFLYAGIVAVFVFARLYVWRKAKASLGSVVILSRGRSKRIGLLQTGLTFGVSLAISIYCIFVSASNVFSGYLSTGILGAIAGSFGGGALMNLLPVGLYEYGALTISGPLFYSKLEKYEIAKTWNEELRIIKFYPKQRHTRSIYQLYLLTEDIPAAKKFFRTFSQVVSQKSTNEDTREPL